MQADNQRILSEDMIDLKLYNLSGTSYTAKGRITSIGLNFTPQGQPIVGKKWTVAFHISDFDSITGTNETYEGWQAEFTDSEGNTVQGRFIQPMVDNTFGYVVTTLTANDSGVSL